jgi:hypothetical protein
LAVGDIFGGSSTFYLKKKGLEGAGAGWEGGPVRSTAPYGPRFGPFYFMGPHGSFSGEGRTDPLLDRTVVKHGTVHDPVTI